MRPYDSAVVPDPFEAIVAEAAAPRSAQSKSLQRQRLRRAEILATTRRVLAETGHERLTLRRISEECGVTVQTIRNSFGRREELIVQAVNEHTTRIWKSLDQPATGPNAFIAFSSVIHGLALNTPAFLRGTLFVAFSNDPSLRNLQSHAAGAKTRLLRKMADEDLVRPGVDIAMLADQITKLDTMLMYEWSRRGDEQALLEQMRTGHEILLLGAMRPSAAAALQA